MGVPAKANSEKKSLIGNEEDVLLEKRIMEVIKETHSDELVISLCGFVGTDIHKVAKRLKYILRNKFHYNAEIIELSDYIKQWSDEAKGIQKEKLSRFEYVKTLIDGGNSLRKEHGGSTLAEFAIRKMALERDKIKKEKGDKGFKSLRHCYIIDSLKNIEELEILKLVYRDIHYSIGIFSSIEIRNENLKNDQMTEVEIDQLVDRDSGEEIMHGQQVRDTFTHSDFFLRIDSYSQDELDKRLERFMHLIFGSAVITPTIEENAMYQAFSAAGNSACLSRQVGATLTDKDGEILSIGWNDVPKTGGNLYHTDFKDPLGKNDHRCFNIGKGCWNDKEKNIISDELVKALIESKIIPPEKRDEAYDKIRNSKIKGLVEFSRAIHAEMHAIILGSQLAGERVREGMLFITTYPCHNCARHIIVAGIKRVYYIEPYRKSLTTRLHFDAITEKENHEDKVKILMYDGVAPSRYLQLFKTYYNLRKENDGSGKEIEHKLKEVKPKVTLSLEAFPVLELVVAKKLKEKGLEITK